MEDYKVFELKEIKEQICRHAATQMGKDSIMNEEVVFEYLRINRYQKRSKDMLDMVIHFGELPFGGIHDITQTVRRATMDGVLTPYELVGVADQLDAAKNMVKHVSGLDREYENLKDILSSIVTHDKITAQIRPCFSPSNEIVDNASPKLKSIRTSIRQAESSISSAMERFLQAHSSQLMEHVVVYRNERSAACIKASEKNSIKGIIHGESMSGQSVYIEPECVIGLNNQLQSLKYQEGKEIERILYELSQLVKGIADDLLANNDTFTLLDNLHAKAVYGKVRNGCMPTFTKDNSVLYIKNAAHPLIDEDKVVRNTIRLDEGKRVLLITGPNTGGKTVNLKIIGLFVLLSYMGVPLPCDEAVIGFYDRVFVDLGDEQSIVTSLSTFAVHLSKLAEICTKATASSLVLIDEFGSGTDPKEGESLAIAVLNHLRSLGTTTIVTTHYGRLKLYGRKHKDILMSQVEFDMETLAPTYRFIMGSTGQSNALDIAARFGIPKGIVSDAWHIKRTAMSEEEQLNTKLESLVNENESLKYTLKQELEEVRAKEEALDKKLSEFETQKQQMKVKAEEELAEYIEEKKLEAEEIIEVLQKSTTLKQHEITALKTQLKNIGEVEKKVEKPSNKHELTEGDFVHIIPLGKIGEIVKINKNRGEAQVLLHGTKMKISLDSLRFSHIPKPDLKPKQSVSFKRPASVSMECNLIGMHVDEALVTMEKYLDDALLGGLKSVRIIHGHGTGALRSAVHEKLKRTKFVDSYRLGGAGEGGVGATVVTFKGK
ncbi:MAG: endonuclease MutS2 [Erysipelotrichales bacterium]|nr:endonuclease MutS2 [Erysipelotrichales bacterium]